MFFFFFFDFFFKFFCFLRREGSRKKENKKKRQPSQTNPTLSLFPRLSPSKNSKKKKKQSHNRKSVEAAVAGMRARNLDPLSSPVSFGQLLGMADSLTFGLAARGFDALTILAYGDLSVVCAFLVRRAQENASALGGARAESAAQAREVARRLFGSSVSSSFSSPSSSSPSSSSAK